jgi:hypothetical protein
MNEERTGLVLSMMATGKKFSRMESINNGRIILFSDILGAKLFTGGWNLSDDNRFHFILITNEDELNFEMDALGVTWLQAVQEMVVLTKIPKPSSRSISISPAHGPSGGGNGVSSSMSSSFAGGRGESNRGGMSSAMNSFIEFSSTNSGAVYSCSSDVQLILEGFTRVTAKSPIVNEIRTRLNTILKLIPELKYNKEAGFIFGERIEEIIRTLGDSETGILYIAKENDKSLLNFHLTTFNNKLQDIIQYFLIQCKSGWLLYNLKTVTRSYENMKQKLDHYDYELISILNILVKAMGLNSSLLMDKKEYSMVVDIKKSIEALGGIDQIYHDHAKERALARLIQSEGSEVHNELVEYMKQHPTNPTNSIDSSSSNRRSGSKDSKKSKLSGENRGRNNSSSSGKVSCWRSVFSCCYSSSAATESDDTKYQLYDEKNVITVTSPTNPVGDYGSKRHSNNLRMSNSSRSSSAKSPIHSRGEELTF